MSGRGYNNNVIKHPENKKSVNEFINGKNIMILKEYEEDMCNKINDYNFPKNDKIIKNILESLNNFEIYGNKLNDKMTVKGLIVHSIIKL